MNISADELRTEEIRLKYLNLLERPDVFPTRGNWKFIASNSMQGMARLLYQKFLTALTIDENDREQLHDIAIEEFPEYISAIDRTEAIDALYSDVTTVSDITVDIIRRNNLFDAKSLLKLIETGHTDIAVQILDVYQPSYSESDIRPMEKLLERIDRLPRIGYIEHRSGIFGASEKFICPDGHSNPADTEYCTHAGCGKNARGLTEPQEYAINLLSNRIEALKELLKKKKEQDRFNNSDI